MPMVSIWGQFPQYRGREGAVDTIEDRINDYMERSMNGRARDSAPPAQSHSRYW
jgi:thiosulfate dehydrogenase